MEPGIAQSSPTSPHPAAPTFSHWPALGLWLGLQLLVLLIPVTQTPLSDQFPRPPERQALYIMTAGQIALSALVFPMLFRCAGSIAAMIGSAWPMLLLSGLLASVPAARIAVVASYVSAWLGTLALWNFFLKSRRMQLIGVALASAVALGGPLLAYLRADFGRGVDSQVLVDPIACAFALVDAPASLAPWRSVIGAALVAMLIAAILVVRRRSKAHLRVRDNSAPTYPQPGQRLSH